MIPLDINQVILFLESTLTPTADRHLCSGNLIRAMEDTLTDSIHNAFNRRDFIQGALAGAALAALPIPALSADTSDLQSVLSQIPKLHD
jgi:hypothetical protein